MFRLFSPLLLVVLVTTLSLGQEKPQSGKAKQPPGKKSEPNQSSTIKETRQGPPDHLPEEHLTNNQKQALLLLKQLFTDAESINDVQLKIQVKAQSAEALWPYDPIKSRQQFIACFNEVDSINTPQSDDNRLDQTKSSSSDTAKIKSKLRGYIARLISRHDAALADNLIKSVENEDIRLSLASNLAEPNPGYAATIIKDTLKNGFFDSQIVALLALNKKDPELANAVFTEMLLLASNNKRHYTFNSLTLLGLYLTESIGKRSIENDHAQTTVIRSYLQYAYKVVAYQLANQQPNQAGGNSDQNIAYLVLHRLVPMFDQFLPEQSAMIRQHLQELSLRVSTGAQNEATLNRPKDPSSVEDFLKKAEAAPSLGEKDSWITRAAMLTVQNDDDDKALFICLKIHDYELKASLTSLVHYQIGAKAVNKQNIDQILKHAREVTSIPRQRWTLYIKAASLSIGKGNSDQAREYLNEIESYVAKLDDQGGDKALGLFEIARSWTKLDIIRAFDVTEAAVKALSKAEFNNNAPSKGKITKTKITLDDFDFDTVFSALVNFDFIRAMGIARSIEKADAAILAQIAVCRASLPSIRKGV